VNTRIVVDKSDVILAVHALIEDDGQTLFGVIEAAENAEHFIDDLVKDLGIVFVA